MEQMKPIVNVEKQKEGFVNNKTAGLLEKLKAMLA